MKNLELASASDLSASARAGAITVILAAAIVRSLDVHGPKQRAQSTAPGLDFRPRQSVHTTPYQEEKW